MDDLAFTMDTVIKVRGHYLSPSHTAPNLLPEVGTDRRDALTPLMKFSKCNSFQIISDLLNIENFKVAITQLCNESQVWNFTML